MQLGDAFNYLLMRGIAVAGGSSAPGPEYVDPGVGESLSIPFSSLHFHRPGDNTGAGSSGAVSTAGSILTADSISSVSTISTAGSSRVKKRVETPVASPTHTAGPSNISKGSGSVLSGASKFIPSIVVG